MNAPVRYQWVGTTCSEIAASVEDGIRRGRLVAGDRLPPVRGLAEHLGVSPGTAAAAYRSLQMRGMTVSDGRRGTRIADRPSLRAVAPRGRRATGALGAVAALPPGVCDLSTGNPDPLLLPDLRPHFRALGEHDINRNGRLYGEPNHADPLLDLALGQFGPDKVAATHVAVVGGALDGVERVLQAHLRPGDEVVVEDPGYPAVLDLLGALGLRPVPCAVDGEGFDPEAFAVALAGGAKAAVVTPRAQNPTGAVLRESRARRLRAVLRRHPDVLIVEDDHAGAIAGAGYVTLSDRRRSRWAVVRSVSKSLGPDLRMALLAGDEATIARVEGRRQLGVGWVSHLLQRVVVSLWSDPAVDAQLEVAAAAYQARRHALVDALARRGVTAHGSSGLNVWVPVDDESAVVARMLAAGWAVAPGFRFRRQAPPAIRVTVAALAPDRASAVAADLAQSITAITPRTG